MFAAKIECWIGLWVIIPFIKKVLKLSDNMTAVTAAVATATGLVKVVLVSSIEKYF